MTTNPRKTPPRGRSASAAWSLAVVSMVLLVAAIVLDQVCRARGLRDELLLTGSSLTFFIALLSALGIGALVAKRQPSHPVGWLIWLLGLSILFSYVAGAYASLGLVGHMVGLPGVGLSAGLANAAFVPWLTLLTLILVLTPSGKLQPGWGRTFVAVCVGFAVVFFTTRLLRPGALDAPLNTVDNPLGVPGDLSGVLHGLEGISAIAVNLGLLTSVAVLIGRFLRAAAEDRARLKWIAVAAVGIAIMAPVPAIAFSQLSPSTADTVISVVVGLAFMLVLLGIGAGVLRYRLYDVGRVLSAGTTYFLLTILVVVVFVVVTLGLSQVTSSKDSSSLSVATSTLLAAGAAGVLRGRVQDAVDSRFRRRRYEADSLMRAFLARPRSASDDAQNALREATGDQSIRVGYPLQAAGHGFVSADGSAFEPSSANDRGTVLLTRGTELVARIDHDPDTSPTELVRSCAHIALAELDNIRLRAELRMRLVEAEHSRARLAQAASAERHRLERNLHDGAQQRLVAVMVGLRTTSLRATRGVPNVNDLQTAIDDLQIAVRELRELASGLVPALRSGLTGALHDLAGKCPLRVLVDVSLPRLGEAMEETAYYVAAEGLANVMKHAGADQVSITASAGPTGFVLELADNGIGGADPSRPGLLGLADRAHVLRGELHVNSPTGGGTLLRLELPCA